MKKMLKLRSKLKRLPSLRLKTLNSGPKTRSCQIKLRSRKKMPKKQRWVSLKMKRRKRMIWLDISWLYKFSMRKPVNAKRKWWCRSWWTPWWGLPAMHRWRKIGFSRELSKKAKTKECQATQMLTIWLTSNSWNWKRTTGKSAKGWIPMLSGRFLKRCGWWSTTRPMTSVRYVSKSLSDDKKLRL